MPRIQAQTDAGESLHIHVPAVLSWVLGVAASLITVAILWATSTLVGLDQRVTVIERTRFTSADAVQMFGNAVTRSEYDATQTALQARLDRIENKLDRALEGR